MNDPPNVDVYSDLILEKKVKGLKSGPIFLCFFLECRIKDIETGISLLIYQMSKLPRTLSWKKVKSLKFKPVTLNTGSRD